MPKAQKRKVEDATDDGSKGTQAAQKSPVKKKQKASKASEEKRVNATGATVRYSAAASQKVKERIARALPGTALTCHR